MECVCQIHLEGTSIAVGRASLPRRDSPLGPSTLHPSQPLSPLSQFHAGALTPFPRPLSRFWFSLPLILLFETSAPFEPVSRHEEKESARVFNSACLGLKLLGGCGSSAPPCPGPPIPRAPPGARVAVAGLSADPSPRAGAGGAWWEFSPPGIRRGPASSSLGPPALPTRGSEKWVNCGSSYVRYCFAG